MADELLPEKCPTCGAGWQVQSHRPTCTPDDEGMGRFTMHIDTSKNDAGRCFNGHGWPNDEDAPHPYQPPTAPRENRWGVMIGHENLTSVPDPERPGWHKVEVTGDTAPSYYTVVDIFRTSTEEVRFGPHERNKAEAFAAERNRYEAQGPLDPVFAERRERLKKLAPDFGSYFYEGPPEARWPVRPGKYLIHDWGVGWHPEDSYDLVEDLEAVRQAIAEDEANVGIVTDLDTGEEVTFEREVVVKFPTA